MTAEKFHDALGLLPSDLITETDKVRSGPQKSTVHWRRWVSLAACAVLILGCGWLLRPGLFSAKSADTAECAALEGVNQTPTYAAADLSPQETANEKSQTTAGTGEQGLTPTGYPADGSWYADLSATQYCITPLSPDSAVNTAGAPDATLVTSRTELDAYYEEKSSLYNMSSFREVIAAYDEIWFTEHDLLLIRVGSILDEVPPEVRSLAKTTESTWEITLFQSFTTASAEPADWHILITMNKDAMTGSDTITILVE